MRTINKNSLAFLLMLILLCPVCSISSLRAQDVSSSTDDLPTLLFQSEEPLFLTLTMDTKSVLHDREAEESHPAEISYTDPEGNIINPPVKIKLRGNFRKDPKL